MNRVMKSIWTAKEAYSRAIDQTDDKKLIALFARLKDQKENQERIFSRVLGSQINVDPSISMGDSLTEALQYFRMISTRKDRELLDLCEREESRLRQEIEDTLDQEKLSTNEEMVLRELLNYTKSTIALLEKKGHAMPIS